MTPLEWLVTVGFLLLIIVAIAVVVAIVQGEGGGELAELALEVLD